ncbi:MAG TPA: hypothetical protein VGM88_35025 [Kofleriaceae bacterium]|jgi:hypothetical protein
MAVRLTLIDVATSKIIGQTSVPPEQLPETFARETTMHIGGDDWHVVVAEPETRAEAVKLGRLRLELAKVTKLSPKDILFSLPSIESALPPLADGDVRGAHRIHEDMWRQREVLAKTFELLVEAERALIRAVWDERQGAGFARIHVRDRIPSPLEGVAMPLSRVARGDRRDVAIGAYVVTGGFAYDHDGVTVFGREIDGQIVALCADAIEALEPFAHGLLLVDWLTKP